MKEKLSKNFTLLKKLTSVQEVEFWSFFQQIWFVG